MCIIYSSLYDIWYIDILMQNAKTFSLWVYESNVLTYMSPTLWSAIYAETTGALSTSLTWCRINKASVWDKRVTNDFLCGVLFAECKVSVCLLFLTFWRLGALQINLLATWKRGDKFQNIVAENLLRIYFQTHFLWIFPRWTSWMRSNVDSDLCRHMVSLD